MTHTALTADEEIRRLRRLGEAKHDWCEVCPAATLPDRDAPMTQSLRALGAALLHTFAAVWLPTNRAGSVVASPSRRVIHQWINRGSQRVRLLCGLAHAVGAIHGRKEDVAT